MAAARDRHHVPFRPGQPVHSSSGTATIPASAGGSGQAGERVTGTILDVAVDIRRGSPTYGKHVATELSVASGDQLYIPVGFAHGFLTLEDDVVIMYKVSDYCAPALDSGIRWDDPRLQFRGRARTSI